MVRLFKKLFLGLFFLIIAGSICLADDSASKIKLDIKEFKLKNGMMFLVVERHTTPQVAFRLGIRAGSTL